MSKISVEEYKRVEAQCDMLDFLQIKPFTSPVKRWMKKTVKYHRKNEKFQGASAINWNRLAETVR